MLGTRARVKKPWIIGLDSPGFRTQLGTLYAPLGSRLADLDNGQITGPGELLVRLWNRSQDQIVAELNIFLARPAELWDGNHGPGPVN